MTTIKSHLSTGELEARYETARDAIGKSHFHALWLLSKGLEIAEVAELLSFSRRWVYQLIKRYNAGGPDSLGDQRVNNGTEPRIVTPEALAGLRQRIKAPPDGGGVWSGPKVARWLATFHALKSVHDQRGWDALVAIEYSIQKPRPRHPEAATSEDRAKLKQTDVSSAVCKEMFQAVLADFAKSIGVGKKRRVVLQLDQAGWHGPENLDAPDGIRLVFQPSHSPELQPAEHLWPFVDEPLANTYFETIEDLDKVVGERCVALMEQQDMIRDSTLFHWWPRQRATK